MLRASLISAHIAPRCIAPSLIREDSSLRTAGVTFGAVQPDLNAANAAQQLIFGRRPCASFRGSTTPVLVAYACLNRIVEMPLIVALMNESFGTAACRQSRRRSLPPIRSMPPQ
jgi:hypothetical protein